jgi:hypothetical protein
MNPKLSERRPYLQHDSLTAAQLSPIQIYPFAVFLKYIISTMRNDDNHHHKRPPKTKIEK